MERAEDGGDEINIQPARVSLCIQPLERGLQDATNDQLPG
jgi:hypothetical protein